MEQENQGILLETGTNEVEIAIFQIGGQDFGTNVAKIREFIIFENHMLTKLVNSHPSMVGTFLLRGHTIPLIDLNKHLKRMDRDPEKRPVIIVSEFNNVVNGFLVDHVDRIIRVSWEGIQPLSKMYSDRAQKVTGSVSFEDREILLLDLEQIISDIFPDQMKAMHQFEDDALTDEDIFKMRQKKRILIAEDSALIREVMLKNLRASGYTITDAVDNGKKAYDRIVDLKKKAGNHPITQHIDLVISDIEMPQLDGLTLTKRIKEDLKLEYLPVVIFSSLISEQMIQKCNQVGADGYITKPEIGSLVELVDSILFDTGEKPAE